MKALLLAIPAALSLCACATITRGTTQAFTVETTPPGASVETTLGLTCKSTPCTFPKVARNASFSVTITKEGYKTLTTNITNEMTGGGGAALAGNILVGGIIGVALDGSNGSMMDLKPNPLSVTLEPVGAAVAGEPGKTVEFNQAPAGTPAS
jgi:hypothetical protein